MSYLLLSGGTVLVHDDKDKISSIHADVLIKDTRILKIAPNIPAPETCEILDCTDKIVSPGFIDTHHHVWQSALKGLFGNMPFFPFLSISS